MKLTKTILTMIYLVLLTMSANVSALADNQQIAYLTPSVNLQHSRDAASSAYHATNFASALQEYQKICQSTTANAKDYYWLGETYFHLDRYGDAAQSFERAVAIEPRLDAARVRTVQAYLFNKQPEIAREKCTAAMSVVTDPIARQQLNSLEQCCTRGPAALRIAKPLRRSGARLGE